MPDFSELRLAFEACCQTNKTVLDRFEELAELLPVACRAEVWRELRARYGALKWTLSPHELNDWLTDQVEHFERMTRRTACNGCGVHPCECINFTA